jgi:hypothetical protein
MNTVGRMVAEDRTRREALAPWAPELRWELAIGNLTPSDSARRMRRLAKEMTVAARLLRIIARERDAEAAGQ